MSRAAISVALTTRLPTTEAGGIESAVREIAPRLVRMRPDWNVSTIFAFENVTRWNRIPLLGDLLAALSLVKKAAGYDIVVVNGAEYAWPFMFRKRDRARTIVIWHGTRVGEIPALAAKMSFAVKVYHALETWLQRYALGAARSIAVSETTRDEIRNTYHQTDSIEVIPNGAPEVGSHLRIGSETGHRVAWIGTSPHKKGLDIALDACERVRNEFPDLELLVIGTPLAGDRSWVSAGRCDHAASLAALRSADVLLATSRYEGCSVAILEALALGLPVIAAPSVAWMIGQGGVAIDNYAAEAFARALRAIFASPATLGHMSRAAIVAAKAFDWDSAADAYAREINMTLCG